MRCDDLWKVFKNSDLSFFTGVPDSTFNAWMTFLNLHHDKELTNIVACNECEAVAIATGYYLATSKIGVVYMQNAGEGKTINPLVSLCHPEIYSIPLILMIGWRGEPGKKDEPQHSKMGKITIPLLDLLDIPHELLPQSLTEAEQIIKDLKKIAESKERPVALIVKRGILEKNGEVPCQETEFELSREEAIKTIIDNLSSREVIVSTTGKTSRELFEYRLARNEIPQDFYTVGGMGCASAIAFGAALQNPNKKVIILDGDGSLLMQMGSMATIGHYAPRNLYHILFDNRSHDSTGGQPTVSSTVDFDKIALACGYKYAKTLETKDDLNKNIREMKIASGPAMIVVKVKKGARPNLGRPTTSPIQNKNAFINLLRN